MAGVRACRVCGCTESRACVDPDRGPCWWVAADLCSHCETLAPSTAPDPAPTIPQPEKEKLP